jgi:type IV secretory pathway VirB2 component (pilin)
MTVDPTATPSSSEDPFQTADAPGSNASKSSLPTFLVIVATLIAVLSATTTWVRTQALDTDQWVDSSAELLQDDQVRSALAVYLVDELYAGVDVKAEFQSALPDGLDGLAAPLAGALRGPTIDGVERVLDRPRLQKAWVEANRLAHEKFVAIVRGESIRNISTDNGAIVLDLGSAIVAVGEDLGLPQAALDRIPADLGQITVVESSELADVQDAVRVLDVLSWFLLLVVIILYALAVYLAHGRRREMIRNVGVGLAIAGVLVLMLRSVAVRWSVDSLVDNANGRPIGRVVGNVFTQLLSDMATTAIVIGLVIIAFAALIGPHRWSVATRRWIRSIGDPRLVVTIGAILLLIVLLWWSPGRVFERWITALTLLAMIVGGAFAFTFALEAETPPATDESAPLGGAT